MSREPEIRKDILISVVVPVYNAEKDIERCVKSLLAQSHENMEIILIDDGSLDSSGTICDELARNPGVQVYHQENAGSSAARNTGIQKAKGDYIGFCDSDDYVEKDMYENLLAAATEHPEGKIFQIMTFYETESGEVLEGPKQDSGNVNFIPSEEDFRLLMLHRGDASFCTKLLPLSFMKEYAFPVGKLNEDFELLIRLLQATDGVYNVEKPGYHIVLSDQSNTRGTFKREFYDAMIASGDYKAY